MLLANVFLLLQLSINLFECFVDPNPEHSVQTCFTKDNRPAFCVDQAICKKLDKSLINSLDYLETCPDSDKVCCPFSDGAGYRDAFVVPSGLAWDWTQAWPNMPWITLKSTTSTTKAPAPAPVGSNITSSTGSTPTPSSPNSNQGNFIN